MSIITLCDIRKMISERDKEWEKVVRKLVKEKGEYEDMILNLQQRLGIPLSLDVPRKAIHD